MVKIALRKIHESGTNQLIFKKFENFLEIAEVEDPLYNVYHDACYEIDQLIQFGIQDVIFEIN